jgi:hypothetical protein
MRIFSPWQPGSLDAYTSDSYSRSAALRTAVTSGVPFQVITPKTHQYHLVIISSYVIICISSYFVKYNLQSGLKENYRLFIQPSHYISIVSFFGKSIAMNFIPVFNSTLIDYFTTG